MEQPTEGIRAAGGILTGTGANRGKIAVVHRRRYEGEIGLPKGKVRPGETDVAAAIREVEEETGIRATIRRLAGTTQYEHQGKPKTVTYFLMEAPDDAKALPKDSVEIASVEWLTPLEAVLALTHTEDRNLVFRAFNSEDADMMQKPKLRKPRIWDPPELSRLEGAISDLEIEIKHIAGPPRDEDWWLRTHQHLHHAKQYLQARNPHQGWAALQAAHRALLLNPKDPDRVRRTAILLRRELSKISGWRAQAIRDLICTEKGELLTKIEANPMRVFEAVTLRDEQSQTNYFRVILRRRHLFSLFLLLVAGIVTVLVLSFRGALPDPFNKWGLMVGVALFGALGASLSVARGLLGTDLSMKIPAQQIGSFVIWMRPAIGAASALFSYVLLTAKMFNFFDWDEGKPVIVFMVAITAGFCERFIVGAIENLADKAESLGSAKSKGSPSDS